MCTYAGIPLLIFSALCPLLFPYETKRACIAKRGVRDNVERVDNERDDDEKRVRKDMFMCVWKETLKSE